MVYYEPSARPVVELVKQHSSGSYNRSSRQTHSHQTFVAALLVIQQHNSYKRGEFVPVMVSTGTLTALIEAAQDRPTSGVDSSQTLHSTQTLFSPSSLLSSSSSSCSLPSSWSQRGHVCTPLHSFYAVSSFGSTETPSDKQADKRAYSDSLLAASRLVTDASGKAVLLSPAYISTHFVLHKAPNGRLLRAMHARATDFMLLMLYLWAMLALLTKAYRSVRLPIWVLGVMFGKFVLIAAWSGSVLPWNVHSYVAMDLVSSTVEHGLRSVGLAILGTPLAALLRGAPVVVTESLTRAFAVHVVCAALGAAVILFILNASSRNTLSATPTNWLYALQSHGFVPRHWQSAAISAVAAVLIIAIIGHFIPPEATLSIAERLPADITGIVVAPENTSPAWYFLPLYGLFAWLPSTAAMLVLIASVLYVTFLPAIERTAYRIAPMHMANTSVGACITALINTALVAGILTMLVISLCSSAFVVQPL